MVSYPVPYSAHSASQLEDATELINSVGRRMDWSRQNENVLMDVGCGPGDCTMHVILPSFSSVKKVIAIDNNPGMIDYARENNAHAKIEYHKADVEDRNSMKDWNKQISKVFSVYYLNWCRDQKAAFSNIYEVLQPGGEAGILIILSTPLWDSYHDILQHSRWSTYFQQSGSSARPDVTTPGSPPAITGPRVREARLRDMPETEPLDLKEDFQILKAPETPLPPQIVRQIDLGIPKSHSENLGATYYRDMLTELGFNVIICEEKKRTRIFLDDDEAKANYSALSTLPNHIPDNAKEEFERDLLETFAEHNQDADGGYTLRAKTLTLLIQRPER